MKVIPAIQVGEAIAPATPLPATAVRIVCDGENYTVYEEGDELPPEPVYEAEPESPAGQ